MHRVYRAGIDYPTCESPWLMRRTSPCGFSSRWRYMDRITYPEDDYPNQKQLIQLVLWIPTCKCSALLRFARTRNAYHLRDVPGSGSVILGNTNIFARSSSLIDGLSYASEGQWGWGFLASIVILNFDGFIRLWYNVSWTLHDLALMVLM
jgi:hypothetical protein